MTDTPRDGIFDVVVVGGGPAGSAAARLMALWGHSVVLLTRPLHSHPSIAESIPPSSRKLFEVLGVQDALDGVGFYPAKGNTVWWGASEARSVDFPDGSVGYQVLRSELDSLLLDQAAEAGASVQREATVRRVHLKDRSEAPADVEFEDASGAPSSVAGRFVLDCSGRTGVIASPDLRVHDETNATVALVGVWRADRWDITDDTHTLVESYRDGWAWSIPISQPVRYVTVMVDPRRTDLAKGADRRRLYSGSATRGSATDGVTVSESP